MRSYCFVSFQIILRIHNLSSNLDGNRSLKNLIDHLKYTLNNNDDEDDDGDNNNSNNNNDNNSNNVVTIIIVLINN